MQNKGPLSAKGGGGSRGPSLLSQMAGRNDEDEAMLKEILGELGGSSQFSGMSIKQLF